VFAVFSGAWRREDAPPAFVASDDPAPEGFALQELELSARARVDGVFDLHASVTLDRLGDADVDEAYLATTSLPARLVLEVGILRSSFGRNNEQHLHEQDFARRPWTQSVVGGVQGLRAPGVSLSIELPLPLHARLAGELFTLSPSTPFGDELSAVATLELGTRGGGVRGGASVATLDHGPPGEGTADPDRELVLGIDLHVEAAWLAFTGELAARRAEPGNDWDGTGYGQLVARIGRRFRAGARFDFVGLPEADGLAREYVFTGSVAALPGAATLVRLTFSHEHDPSDSSRRNDTLILQLEGRLGSLD
jgi:hypothetical protein